MALAEASLDHDAEPRLILAADPTEPATFGASLPLD
jgi:hypothetical protein